VLVVTIDVALAAAATIVAMAFGLSTFDRWLRRRRPRELDWTISLTLFAIGAGSLWWGFARGWSAPSFRVFYLTGAILNVPWLALGTIAIVAPVARVVRWRVALVFLSGLAVGVMATAPMKESVPADELPEGRELFGALPRVLAAVGSGTAAMVIIGVAIWTTSRFVRQRVRSESSTQVRVPTSRIVGNLLIATGTLVLSASGAFSGRLGKDRSFVITLLVGIIVLFAGFLASTWASTRTSRSPRAPGRAPAGHGEAPQGSSVGPTAVRV
jgi:hypothetical protein